MELSIMSRENKTSTEMNLPIGRGKAGLRTPEARVKDSRGTFSRLWQYLKAQSKTLVLVIGLVILSTGLSLAGPYLLGRAIDEFIIVGDLEGLARIVLQMVFVYVLAALTTWLQSIIMVRVAQTVTRNLRKDVFDKLETLSLRFFDRHSHGELMSRLSNDVDNISMVLSQNMTQLISSGLTLIGVIVMMILLNFWLALASLIIVPMFFFLTKWTAVRTRKGFQLRQQSLGELNGLIEETVTGARVIKAYVREEAVIADFEVVNRALQKQDAYAQNFALVLGPAGNLVFNIGYAVTAGVGGLLVLNNLATIGTVASFINYVQQLRGPMRQITETFNTIQSALAGAERIFEILDEETELLDPSDAVSFEGIKGQVDFEAVNFSYVEGVPVLKNINLSVEPGQTIALVGPTGAGKTTIINLLSRFYDIDQGKILVDGNDIRQVRKNDLRRQLGIVLQEPFLFSDTVLENIRYGRLYATDEDVIEAAKLSNADHFIRSLPKGYQTVLSERGNDLSQGQRQLLSIARAILADPSILILDEATSSVDTRTEKRIQEALLRLMEGRTSFVIAHRLSTIREADKILVINQGELVESGSHAALIEQKGFYYNLYMSQFKGKLVTV
jgi:ATP-binding cassette subfamily B protein